MSTSNGIGLSAQGLSSSDQNGIVESVWNSINQGRAALESQKRQRYEEELSAAKLGAKEAARQRLQEDQRNSLSDEEKVRLKQALVAQYTPKVKKKLKKELKPLVIQELRNENYQEVVKSLNKEYAEEAKEEAIQYWRLHLREYSADLFKAEVRDELLLEMREELENQLRDELHDKVVLSLSAEMRPKLAKQIRQELLEEAEETGQLHNSDVYNTLLPKIPEPQLDGETGANATSFIGRNEETEEGQPGEIQNGVEGSMTSEEKVQKFLAVNAEADSPIDALSTVDETYESEPQNSVSASIAEMESQGDSQPIIDPNINGKKSPILEASPEGKDQVVFTPHSAFPKQSPTLATPKSPKVKVVRDKGEQTHVLNNKRRHSDTFDDKEYEDKSTRNKRARSAEPAALVDAAMTEYEESQPDGLPPFGTFAKYGDVDMSAQVKDVNTVLPSIYDVPDSEVSLSASGEEDEGDYPGEEEEEGGDEVGQYDEEMSEEEYRVVYKEKRFPIEYEEEEEAGYCYEEEVPDTRAGHSQAEPITLDDD